MINLPEIAGHIIAIIFCVAVLALDSPIHLTYSAVLLALLGVIIAVVRNEFQKRKSKKYWLLVPFQVLALFLISRYGELSPFSVFITSLFVTDFIYALAKKPSEE